MATLAQPSFTKTDANRQNAQHSTGPRTPEGKANVKNNALKHGLSSREVFIGADEVDDYEMLLSDLLETWSPVSQEEMTMVVHIRDLQWRLNSIPALHINLLTLATEEHLEQFEAHADNPRLQRSMARTAAYRTNLRAFEQFSRHEGRLERSIDRAEKRLTEVIAERRDRERSMALAAKQQSTEQSQPSSAAKSAKQSQPPVFEQAVGRCEQQLLHEPYTAQDDALLA